MSQPFPMVPLGTVLTLDERREEPIPGREYRQVGVKGFGQGLFVKDALDGGGTTYRAFNRLYAGAVVMSQVKGWEGAVAVCPGSMAGMYVSPEYRTFRPSTQASSDYLHILTSSPWFWSQLKNLTRGVGGRRERIRPEMFLKLNIPLPPVDEQRRIVARIEELVVKIEEARGLRRNATRDLDRLLITMAHRPDLDPAAKGQRGWVEVALGDVVQQANDIQRVDLNASYPNFGIYSFGRGLFAKPPIHGNSTSATFLRRVRTGQFIYSRLFAFEGAYGMVTDDFDGHFVSGEYPNFRCDERRVNANFLHAYFKSQNVWSQVAAGSKGLGHRRQRVQPEQLLTHRLMLPPLEWQERIAVVQSSVNASARVQAETAAELDALLPSVLDRAFKGEL